MFTKRTFTAIAAVARRARWSACSTDDGCSEWRELEAGQAGAASALPAISGTEQVGQQLTASTGTWSASPISFTYQWRRCNASGSACVDLGGATGSIYMAVAADAGSTLRVVVTATNATGSNAATSNQTAVVAPAIAKPANTRRCRRSAA